MTVTSTTPRLAAAAVALPPHRHSQAEVTALLTDAAGAEFERFANTSGVQTRSLALPLERYRELRDFTEANQTYLNVALELSESALRNALATAQITPDEVDIIFSTTVTGLAVPTLDARLAARIGLRPDVKRVPLFGLGCVAGAAGVARMHDYLRAYPEQVAVLVAVELCSLTIQWGDHSVANMVASSLFGDGAAAVVATGAQRAGTGPQVLASRSRLYPDTEHVMGWEIGTSGFKIVLSADIPTVAEKYLGEDVTLFLAEFGLTPDDVDTWVCHPGGPKVIEAVEHVLKLPSSALDRTRESLRDNGNLSSVSVLDVLRATMGDPPAAGSLGMMIAMGPGFCAELVLLRW
ncbi:type III polyketide synthase [[Mycobacterium] burgundiense]|uniref:3-oxoacyl-[acyl-carrier-protein] synthase III C-terminal domain-containing protein n=1 Tax=[Mycobacterium] burgundiense TaxID=3064286 RepID=A0ABM9LD60_9MYCO|nr:3-oxoacyl-[acyl-carrier-protein] synthase III C-terminal domain-containing protein [Mycolicibacterium sp. MU0053]CAJ1496968.1 3-oxoacyl-[acyl-carrier-protein] synthase III C-terminal domain-containing protein [Mycolicibacterium sp. MU0053]